MADLYRLDGRTAIVTGAGGGLGLGIARALGERGAGVLVCDMNERLLDGARRSLSDAGVRAAACLCDVTREQDVACALQTAERDLGLADILVNNAGITRMQDIMEVRESDWDAILAVNVKGLFSFSQQFARRLADAGRAGHIVNIASNGAKTTYDDQVHYCASKAAVVNMTQCMAATLARYRINVNAVCPGAVETEMLKGCMAATEQQTGGRVTVGDCMKTWGPPQLGRLIQPEEVGRIVAFLCTQAGAMIRGQALNVDAGNTKF